VKKVAVVGHCVNVELGNYSLIIIM